MNLPLACGETVESRRIGTASSVNVVVSHEGTSDRKFTAGNFIVVMPLTVRDYDGRSTVFT